MGLQEGAGGIVKQDETGGSYGQSRPADIRSDVDHVHSGNDPMGKRG